MNEAVEGERQASACGTTRIQEPAYLGPHTGLCAIDFALTRFQNSSTRQRWKTVIQAMSSDNVSAVAYETLLPKVINILQLAQNPEGVASLEARKALLQAVRSYLNAYLLMH
jgi:hypothetical protein